MAKICKECKKEYQQDYNFCSQCAGRLIPKEEYKPSEDINMKEVFEIFKDLALALFEMKGKHENKRFAVKGLSFVLEHPEILENPEQFKISNGELVLKKK